MTQTVSITLMLVGVVLVGVAIVWIMGPAWRYGRWGPWVAIAAGFAAILVAVWLRG